MDEQPDSCCQAAKRSMHFSTKRPTDRSPQMSPAGACKSSGGKHAIVEECSSRPIKRRKFSSQGNENTPKLSSSLIGTCEDFARGQHPFDSIPAGPTECDGMHVPNKSLLRAQSAPPCISNHSLIPPLDEAWDSRQPARGVLSAGHTPSANLGNTTDDASLYRLRPTQSSDPDQPKRDQDIFSLQGGLRQAERPMARGVSLTPKKSRYDKCGSQKRSPAQKLRKNDAVYKSTANPQGQAFTSRNDKFNKKTLTYIPEDPEWMQLISSSDVPLSNDDAGRDWRANPPKVGDEFFRLGPAIDPPVAPVKYPEYVYRHHVDPEFSKKLNETYLLSNMIQGLRRRMYGADVADFWKKGSTPEESRELWKITSAQHLAELERISDSE